jgi:hypothetical protein
MFGLARLDHWGGYRRPDITVDTSRIFKLDLTFGQVPENMEKNK